VRAHVTVERIEENIVKVISRELGEATYGEHEEEDRLYPVYIAAREVVQRSGEPTGLKITVESDIPPGAGMGSSAAVAVATVAATAKLLGLTLTPDEVAQSALAAEVVVHGKPSGIDPTVSSYGGAILFKKGDKPKRINADFDQIRLVLADSGIQRSTGKLVSKVLETKKKFPGILEPLYRSATELVEKTREALENGDFATVGELMNINHGLLSALGVSNAKLEELVYAAREAGALGSKITGAGGGGMVLALCWKEDAESVCQRLRGLAARIIVTPVSDKGIVYTLES
jgi:mevalonate kinase